MINLPIESFNWIKKDDKLYLPKNMKTDKSKISDMPMFKTKTFEVYHHDDAEKFVKLVESLNGVVEGIIATKNFNYVNQINGHKYMIVYYYHKDISMEVKC